MQITNITDVNYIANPNFQTDLTGWSVNNGSIVQNTAQFYAGSACMQFTPTGVYGYANYNLTAMSTGVPYIAQARVKAGVGQQVFIQFTGNQGNVTYTASGGWDLLTTTAVVQNSPSFDVQIGIGFGYQINVGDLTTVSEALTMLEGPQKALQVSVGDATTTTEYYYIQTDGGWLFTSDENASVSDSTQTTESWSVQVGANPPFINGITYYVNVSEFTQSFEYVNAQPNENTDQTIFIDNVMLEQATVAGTYFDGSSGNGYHWYSTANESTSYSRQYELAQASLSAVPSFGALIAWTKTISSNYTFFTIGSSIIGGNDFIPGTATYPTYFNQYQYNANYADYLLSASVTTNIGQYTYGAFGAQLSMVLDNSNLLFLPGFDPVIGNYIINGRPISFQIGFGGEMLNLFSGLTTKPANDIQNRTLTITAYDGMDYLYNFITQGQGPIAVANNGNYVNLPAQTIIGDLLEEAGIAGTQYVAEQSLQSNIGFLCPATYESDSGSGNTGSIGNIISDICEAEQALFFFDQSGVAHFWNREHIPTNTNVSWAFSYADIENFQTEDTPIFNDVTVQAQPRAVQANQNIWQLTSATLVPAATTTYVPQNLAINPNFLAVTGGIYNSPFNINVTDSSVTAEQLFIPGEYYITYNIIDSTQTSETITVSIVNLLNHLSVSDSTATYESISVKVGTNPQYNSPRTISVSDSTISNEWVFMKAADFTHKMIFTDSTQTSEFYNVQVISAARQLPYLNDSTSTYETINISTETVVGWGQQNATLLGLYADGVSGITTECGYATVTGGSSSYIFQQYTCTTNTQYVSQCYIKAPSSTSVTIQAVENGNVLASTTITADGNWDLISLAPFNSDVAHTSFQIQIFANVACAIRVCGVMTQLGVGALSTYFDGSQKATPNYIYTWAGTANQSVTNATPVGSVVIEADFQDENGSLPVTSVDLPVYNNPNLDSSYLTNLNQDSSGVTGSSNIILESVSLSGSTYLMTFINTYSQPIYITNISLYGTPAKVTYSINQEYTNPTSIALYGTNPPNNGQTLLIQNNLIQDPSTALSDAYTIVNDYSSPYTRLNATVFPSYPLQIGDLVQVTINDVGTTGNYTVVGTTNGVGNDGALQQTLELEVKNLVHYFTINTSIIGGTDSIAP